ncbi:hypothetical protein FISHEDRAFT_58015 [Fistulina hepatica ATCC 64428]|uniref:Uncharacterized protein n=1 Tax=Fistulina hepatica ATCC 64428 TaxID=1128425 RepID=A0A0D7AEI1_9AGAR|nr:hypothetical protein FISHEDRAFT_58015 [Fistulina hepatica ATCC 64428]
MHHTETKLRTNILEETAKHTWRSSSNKTRQKEGVDEQLEMLTANLVALTARIDVLSSTLQEHLTDEERSEWEHRLARKLAELENALVQLPRIPSEDDESDNGTTFVGSPAPPSKDMEIASGYRVLEFSCTHIAL